jgi:hypothetical protein
MRTKTLFLCLLVLGFSLPALAQHEGHQMTPEQQKMMEAWQKAATPGAAHRALDAMVGTWDTTIRFWETAGGPAQQSTGTSENRWILGNRYVEQRFKGSAMGMPFEGLGYTGYDNIRKQYFGTWMDSMSTAMMTSTGNTADGGKTWMFKGTMDDPMSGKPFAVEEKITVESNDKHVFEMWHPGQDGKMYKAMEIVYTRKK